LPLYCLNFRASVLRIFFHRLRRLEQCQIGQVRKTVR
jgi:hypothetical protein